MPLPQINKNIANAKTMHSDFYTTDKFYNKSIESIFQYSWQFILIENQLNSNNLYPFIFLEDSINEPLLISKKSNIISCLSNVCTHRGSLLCKQNINSNYIKCPYHGRTFNLDGHCKSAPGFKGVNNFPNSNDNLKTYDINKFKNLIFTSLNPQIEIIHVLEDIKSRLGWFPFDDLEYNVQSSNIYYLDAHWALYCENYLEGFHVPFVHKGLKRDINLNTYKTVLLSNGVLQYAESKSKKNRLNIQKGYDDYKKNIYAYYYWIFPNIMFNFYHWGLSINIIEPINKNKTRIKFLSYPIKNHTQPLGTDASLDKVEKEDQNIVLNVQKGIESKFYNRGRYSPKYESGVHHFHRLLCKHLN